MKILYLAEVNLSIHSGVLSKINEQIRKWVQFGHEVHVASIPPSNTIISKILLTSSAKSYFVHKHWIISQVKTDSIFFSANKVLSIKKYKDYIDYIAPDVIYLREPIGVPGFNRLLEQYKVVMEINTLLASELRGKRSYFLFNKYKDLIYPNVDAFIAVTNEIGKEFIKYNKPVITIPNGIAIDLQTNYTQPKNDRPQLVLVGSPNMSWHGMDKFYHMAEMIPQADFHLVGERFSEYNLPNFFAHGYLGKTELLSLYKKMDIGVGTLALHRKELQEACPLKVRQYISVGLPIIIAYEDTDLSGQNFVLQIDNNENNIHENIDIIRNFINQWKGVRLDSNITYPLVSVEFKEKKRINFIENFLKNKLIDLA